MTPPGPKILVVDDDPGVLSSVERGLHHEGFVVITASDGEAAVRVATESAPDAVVLDIVMPKMDGVEVTRRLRGEGHRIPICVLSAMTDVEHRVAGLQAGADDYLIKPFALAELIARLHALLRRSGDRAPVPFEVGDLRVDPLRRRAFRGNRELDLTQREFDLLEAFARNAGLVLSRTQLLTLVWGYDFEIESNVVDVFVSYLRRKLEAQGEARIVQTVRGTGFVLRVDP